MNKYVRSTKVSHQRLQTIRIPCKIQLKRFRGDWALASGQARNFRARLLQFFCKPLTQETSSTGYPNLHARKIHCSLNHVQAEKFTSFNVNSSYASNHLIQHLRAQTCSWSH